MSAKKVVLSINLTDEEVIRRLREFRFGKNFENLRCVYCRSRNVVKSGWRGIKRRYKCNDCGKYFTDTTNTVFENSKIRPSLWILIAYIHLKLGLTTNAIAREVGLLYKTVWNAVKRIQEAAIFFRDMLRLDEDCEVDETYMNAGCKGRNKRGVGGEGGVGLGGVVEVIMIQIDPPSLL